MPSERVQRQIDGLLVKDVTGEGQEHLDCTIEELHAMKMQPSLERALRHKGLLHA